MLAPKWAHEPLSGAGAALRGGRYNPPGIPALYMSEDFSTAIAEYEQDLGIRPGTLCAYDVDCRRAVDLTDYQTLEALGVDRTELCAPWQHIAFVEKKTPRMWRVAKRLISEDVDAVRVPSAQAAGCNLVLWRWNVEGAAKVVALDPLNDLPKDQSSWLTPRLTQSPTP